MRKIIGLILLIISVAMIIIGSSMLLESKRFIVQFINVDNTEELEIVEGGYIQPSITSYREGYRFVGWFHNGELFDFNTPIIENIKLEAKWEKI